MENLDIANYNSFNYNSDIIGQPVLSCVEDNVCCFLTDSNKIIIWEFLNSTNTYVLDTNIADSAIQLKYLSHRHVVSIATTSSLLLFEPNNRSLNVLHSFTTKIATTSWNPNESFLVVVDDRNIVYGFTFDVNAATAEYSLTEFANAHLDATVPSSVYVGWGSHNTQFQGIQRREEENMEQQLQPWAPPVVSWRGNGEEFVVNFWKNQCRLLKVFTNTLRPEFESRAYPNLLPPTSFKGQGNFIACLAHNSGINKVVLFEKNCQVKSRFPLPENGGYAKYIQFHPEMPILAVYSENSLLVGVLNIYLYSNAHWFLKQQLIYPQSRRLLSFNWKTLEERTMCALNILTTESFERISFRKIINTFPEIRMVAVVDGTSVHFSRFSNQMVPPPMSTLSLIFQRPVNRVLYDPYRNIFHFLSSDNKTYSYAYDEETFTPHDGGDVPNIALDANNNLSDIIYRLERTIDNNHYEFLLDKNLDLIINRTVVCSNVWSMYIHGNYLIFSHASCRLYCVRLSQENLLNTDWNLSKFYSREVEQGAKIVCVSVCSCIIVELPRGNLEAVSCRVIAIDTVEHFLAQNKWQEAIQSIRNQRLTWNLLIDLNPLRFSEHITEFVEAAESASELNNIVSEFSNEDCFRTIYKQCLEEERPFIEYNKNDLFLKVLNELYRLNPVENLNSIVILQTRHFTLKAALKSICSVFETGELEICKIAISHICFHRDARDIITEAYRLYHVAFMAFIYTCCAEDPRAYVPELEQLIILEPTELRYKMNLLAKNYKGATKYLMRVNNVEARYVSEFITKHDTSKIAYETIDYTNQHFQLVSRLYGTFLSQKGRYEEAGFIFAKADQHLEAVEEYKKALNWPQVVSLLETMKVDKPFKGRVLATLAILLLKNERPDEAAMLLEYHCGDYETAIEALIEEKMFQKAFSLAKKHGATDIIEHGIIPAIIEHREDLYARIVDMGSRFIDYCSRLQEIRQQKFLAFKTRQLVLHDEDLNNDDYCSECESVMSSGGSSVGSGSSRGSTRSSRNRRKQARKRMDLRQGTVFEDIALIRQLHVLLVKIFAIGGEVREMCLTLTDCDSFSACIALHERLSNLQSTVLEYIPRIWSPVFLNAAASTEPEIMAVIENREELDEEFRNPPPPEKLSSDWKLIICTISP